MSHSPDCIFAYFRKGYFCYAFSNAAYYHYFSQTGKNSKCFPAPSTEADNMGNMSLSVFHFRLFVEMMTLLKVLTNPFKRAHAFRQLCFEILNDESKLKY